MSMLETQKQIIKTLKSTGISSAEIDAQILLEFVTKKSREFLLACPDYELSDRQIRLLGLLCDRRRIQEPIAYIVGHKEFFGLDFLVDKNVLIPRPETEMLVEQALEFIKSQVHKVASSLKILDVGTGSGNIIISLAKKYRFESIVSNQYFFASDISKNALKIANKNAKKHGVEKTVKFIQSNLFENISGKFDLIIANLPYVPEDNSKIKNQKSKLRNREIDFEPRQAIFAEDNGAEILRRFLKDAKKHIKKNGLIMAELDPRNADDILVFAEQLYNSAEIISDFSGQKRVIKILT